MDGTHPGAIDDDVSDDAGFVARDSRVDAVEGRQGVPVSLMSSARANPGPRRRQHPVRAGVVSRRCPEIVAVHDLALNPDAKSRVHERLRAGCRIPGCARDANSLVQEWLVPPARSLRCR